MVRGLRSGGKEDAESAGLRGDFFAALPWKPVFPFFTVALTGNVTDVVCGIGPGNKSEPCQTMTPSNPMEAAKSNVPKLRIRNTYALCDPTNVSED